ncbi:MAG TPA: isoprenylcysteine carboxylmethyltransferase family protein [Candidatus Acidoferrales bacterium]|nr:isoprenylcysteine carboxylmethyltransferase family protein [Candidatus Acidoferrales bacterium]
MLTFLRHTAAIAILPVTIVVLVPVWIARQYGVLPGLGRSAGAVVLQLIGLVVFVLGLGLFIASLRRFATEGKGTLAPWDPPRVFVASGPYRFVRNPMISGVIFMVSGEALLLLSLPHAAWAAFCLVLNLIYIPLVEEPQLSRRFGASYEEYRRNVPRFVPRLKPWRPNT